MWWYHRSSSPTGPLPKNRSVPGMWWYHRSSSPTGPLPKNRVKKRLHLFAPVKDGEVRRLASVQVISDSFFHLQFFIDTFDARG